MITSDSIKRMFDTGVREVFRPPYFPKILRKKGKTKLTLNQISEWTYRFW